MKLFTEIEAQELIDVAHDHGQGVSRGIEHGELEPGDEDTLPPTVQGAASERDVPGCEQILPREGWRHFACPTCKMVSSMPWVEGDDVPYCLHNGRDVKWRPDVEERWTPMVQALVARAEQPDG